MKFCKIWTECHFRVAREFSFDACFYRTYTVCKCSPTEFSLFREIFPTLLFPTRFNIPAITRQLATLWETLSGSRISLLCATRRWRERLQRRRGTSRRREGYSFISDKHRFREFIFSWRLRKEERKKRRLVIEDWYLWCDNICCWWFPFLTQNNKIIIFNNCIRKISL